MVQIKTFRMKKAINRIKMAEKDIKKSRAERLWIFAVRTRLELATLGVTGRYSNQLNYRTSFD